jgi:hypothetical protein
MDKTWMPTVAGILSVIAGAFSFLGSIFIGIAVAIFFSSSYDGLNGQNYSAVAAWIVLFVPYFTISIVAVVGGVYALKRRVWGLALAGSICALLTMWAWPLGVAAIVFIALSRNEFGHVNPMSPPSTSLPVSPPDAPAGPASI